MNNLENPVEEKLETQFILRLHPVSNTSHFNVFHHRNYKIFKIRNMLQK